jgi:predicted N-acetyltransferase YhbS
MSSQKPFSVRRARPEDAASLLDCLRAAFEPYRALYTPAAFADTVLTPGTLGERLATMAVFVAATASGEVVGTVACQVVGVGEGHLRGMAVRPSWQGRGVAEMTALGRVGEPDDIGPMIASLLSDDNRWVNGQRIEVSGGMAL